MTAPPKDGWAEELREARSAAKRGPPSAGRQIRVVRASRKLRRWTTTKAAAELGLSVCSGPGTAVGREEERRELSLSLMQAEQELSFRSERSVVTKPWYADEIRNRVQSGEADVDTIRARHKTFSNLNILQLAAVSGDVCLVEDLVALGAALDYPVLDVGQDEEHGEANGFHAPPGTTALLLACTVVAMHALSRDQPGLSNNELSLMGDGCLQCAIRLVELGANVGTRLPPSRDLVTPITRADFFNPNFLWKKFDISGKSAREVAIISQMDSLIGAIERLETKEAKETFVNCRCGSRLPWKQCHAGRAKGEYPIYLEDINGLHWRYSPVAKCPCKHSEKKHYSCCWIHTDKPRYMDDVRGNLVLTRTIPLHGNPEAISMARALAAKKASLEAIGADLNQFVFPERAKMTSRERSKSAAECIRSEGLQFLDGLHPKCCFCTYDTEVVAGCIERIEDHFFWTNCHWRVEKSDLLLRVREWNEALESYCDDEGLGSEEKSSIIAKHKASPFAPCANLLCNSLETKVKEFRLCTRCKLVAYCSKTCLSTDWKNHKPRCF